MKRKALFFMIVVLYFSLSSCAKKKNTHLARTYYQMSTLELLNEVDTEEKEQLACKRALDYIDKAIEQDDQPEYLAFKATLLFKLKHFDESSGYFKKALNKQTQPAIKGEILNNYACLLAENGKIDEAFGMWRALEVDPYYLTPEVAFFNEGKVFATLKEYDKAKTCFLKATTFAPNYLDAHYFLALTAIRCGDLALAKNSISSVLYLEPTHTGAAQVAQKLGISFSAKPISPEGNYGEFLA